ncbi:TetR family transcriptional regulator [Glycomyces sp. NPDC047010]|uniref:TetR/AcrR family transcriptional regulator n=1 Tax=Glycomyces sp. NPDC047010 TaxID=3155023 RepID=UPI003403FC10
MTEAHEAATGAQPTRAERRRRSEAAILKAATTVFAETGYDRTTIRAVAQRAGVDPALVMQHFASKERLFAAATEQTVPTDSLLDADIDGLSEAALDHAFAPFEDPELRAQAEALLRSSLTHPAALKVLRDDVMVPVQTRLAANLGDQDAALKAALLNASMLGVVTARYLLDIPALAEADIGDLRRLLLPALDALLETSDRDDPARPGGES